MAEAEWTEDDYQRLLKQFGTHLVCFAGAYQQLDENEKPVGEEKFYSYTGFIISTGGHWFIVTAGHVLKDIEEKSRDKRVRITGRSLADYFGDGAAHPDPIPFDVLNEPKVFIDNRAIGLDVGVVYLRPYYRNLLKANNVRPAPFRREPIEDYSQFYGFSIVGFPDEKSVTLSTSNDPQVTGAVMPVLVPIKVDVEAPTDNLKFPRLVGTVADMGDLASIVGISGGPMLGYRQEGDKTLYEVVGLQSRWKEAKKITYGCPILPFLELLDAKRNELPLGELDESDVLDSEPF